MTIDKIYHGNYRSVDALLRLYLLSAVVLGCVLYIVTQSELVYKQTCKFHTTYILFDGPKTVSDICDMVVALILIAGWVTLAVDAAG